MWEPEWQLVHDKKAKKNYPFLLKEDEHSGREPELMTTSMCVGDVMVEYQLVHCFPSDESCTFEPKSTIGYVFFH